MPKPMLVGFERDKSFIALCDLFADFGMIYDFRATLPDHLLEVLRKQHANIVIETIELLDSPKCNSGGMQDEHNPTIIKLQTLEVPLDLRLTLRAESRRHEMDVRLVIKGEDLDSEAKTTSDLFVVAQRAIS